MTIRDTSLRELQKVLRDIEDRIEENRALINAITVPEEKTGWTKQDMKNAAYNDLLISPASMKLPGSSSPDETAWKTSLKKLFFAVGEYVFFEGMQFPHSYIPGTDFYPHVHFCPSTALADTESVVWEIEYSGASVWSVFPAVSTATCTFTNNAAARAKLPAASLSGTDIVADTHLIAGGATISGIGYGLSAVVDGRLTRVAGTGYTDDAILLSTDAHIRINRLGSQQEYTG